jgi:hypothetical protein
MNVESQLRLEVWLKQYSACSASSNPVFKAQSHQREKERERELPFGHWAKLITDVSTLIHVTLKSLTLRIYLLSD